MASQKIFAQDEEAKNKRNEDFYLYYGIFGLGVNLGYAEPALIINNNKFIYGREPVSYPGKRNKRIKLISKGKFYQNSIDSILCIVHGLEDTTIYKVNPCIMGGAVIYIIIAHGTDTTKFTLDNTFECRALKIIDIINPYLPKDKKLYGSAKEIEKEEDCWRYLRRQWKEYKDSTKAME